MSECGRKPVVPSIDAQLLYDSLVKEMDVSEVPAMNGCSTPPNQTASTMNQSLVVPTPSTRKSGKRKQLFTKTKDSENDKPSMLTGMHVLAASTPDLSPIIMNQSQFSVDIDPSIACAKKARRDLNMKAERSSNIFDCSVDSDPCTDGPLKCRSLFLTQSAFDSPIGKQPPALHGNTHPIAKDTESQRTVQIVKELHNKYLPEGKTNKQLKDKTNKQLKDVVVFKYELGVKYEYIGPLGVGQGCFGNVGLYRNYLDGQQYAIKMTNRKRENKKDKIGNKKEGHILAKVNGHNNIISYHRFWHDFKHYYIVMEYCAGKSLFDHLICLRNSHMQFTVEELRHLAKNLLSGAKYLHEVHKIVHADIKPANILLKFPSRSIKYPSQQVYKICDFGHANLIKNMKDTDGNDGDSNYQDPHLELRCKENFDATKLDIYSIAMVVAECKYLKRFDPTLSEGSLDSSWELNKLISNMMVPEMKQRPTAHEALVELEALDGSCESLLEENARLKAEIKRLKAQHASVGLGPSPQEKSDEKELEFMMEEDMTPMDDSP